MYLLIGIASCVILLIALGVLCCIIRSRKPRTKKTDVNHSPIKTRNPKVLEVHQVSLPPVKFLEPY